MEAAMKNSPVIGILFLVSSSLAWPAHALDGGVESLRQTSKAFASVARSVSPAAPT
jgi:serine protease Do